MTDPLDALRLPVEPARPDPGFAARLRERLQHELLNPPRGDTAMTTTATTPTASAEEIPLHSLTPYVAVGDARAALEFYTRAFGARRRGEPIVMDDGRIGHAEVAIGDSVLMLADEFAEIGHLAPDTNGGVSQSLHLRVADPDTTVGRAVELGAELERPVADQPYGRGGVVIDPFGHRWQVMGPSSSLHTLTPRLSVADARSALEFYTRAFGARRRGEPYVMDDGRIGHAEVAVGDSVLMLADEWPEDGLLGPLARGGVSQQLNLQVADPDAAVQRAVELGAELERPVGDNPYGRAGVVIDPFGHRWMVVGGATRSGRSPGELGYASLWVPDVQRAAAFFSHVLGWTYYGHGRQHRMVEGADPHHGIVELAALPAGLWDAWPRHATLFTSHAVPDVDAAVARVRAAGGQATEPHQESYGPATECLDDQGMPFAVHQDTPGTVPAGSPGHGQIAYLTFEVRDSARARAFFGAVFGWRFTPGHVADGWQIEGMTPMGGISGGHEHATIVPMYAVDDVGGAVARVREAGGTASDPEAQPYGAMSFCADDQGTRFYLGELG